MTPVDNGKCSHLHSLISSLPSPSTEEPVDEIWSNIRTYAISHPEEVCDQNREGRSSLHAICAKRPPLEVVQSFLNLEESVALLKSKDNDGRIPLTISAFHKADSSVINLLLKAYPEGSRIEDNDGYLPLHLSCAFSQENSTIKILLRAFPEGAARRAGSLADETPLFIAIMSRASVDVIDLLVDAYPAAVIEMTDGMTALKTAMDGDASTDVIQLLIDGNPESLTKVDELGYLPIQSAISSKNVDLIKLLCANSPLDVVASLDTFDVACEEIIKMIETPHLRVYSFNNGITSIQDGLKPLWEVLIMILRVSVYKTRSEALPNKGTSRILHDLVQTECPRRILRFCIHIYPNQVKEMDEVTKQLPIALLLLGPSSSSKEAVNLLLDKYPEAAEILDSTGRCLLSLAAENCLLEVDLIEKIYILCPRMLVQPDPTTKLYPFMLAAVPKQLKTEKERSQKRNRRSMNLQRHPSNLHDIERRNSLTQINMILELLLASPALVGHNLK